MGVVEWFLGIHFSWRITSTSVAVHLNQSGFAANLVESFFQDSRNVTPMATPYRSGVPIDSIAPSTDDNDSPANFAGQLLTKVLSAASVGSPVLHVPIFPPLTPSLHHTATNLPSAT